MHRSMFTDSEEFKVFFEKDSHDFTPFHSASYNGHLQVVQFLRQFVQNVDIKTDSYWNNRTPLHAASLGGHIEVVKYLISQGADPRIKLNNNQTAYDLANENNHQEVANYLLQVERK